MSEPNTTEATETATTGVIEGTVVQKTEGEAAPTTESKGENEATPMDTSEEGKKEEETRAEIAAVLTGKTASSSAAGTEEASAAKDGEAAKGNKNNLPIRAYLDSTVVPVLLSALSQLVKERPDGDAVEWLAHWMLRNNPSKKAN